MDRNEYSRREFLRRFAMFSSASLLIGLNTGCGSSDPEKVRVIALYGPVPVYGPLVLVDAIYFNDNQSNRIPLQNSQNVFILVVCLVDFSKDMNTSAPTTITFNDSAGRTVPFSKSWRNSRTLEVAPLSQLLFNTTYTLSVGNDAEDTLGNKIILTPGAAATFRTGSA
jgi:hypothetical protein